MSTKQTEALKLARDFISAEWGFGGTTDIEPSKIVRMLEEALADSALDRMAENAREIGLDYEPTKQQEPVAWRVRWPKMGGGYAWVMNDCPVMAEHGFINEPLYTSPPANKPWVGLTQEQRASIAEANNILVDDDLFDAIEAKLREKNA